MANKVDIRSGDGFFVGSNFVIYFQAFNPAGVPEIMNGWTLVYTMRRRTTDAALLTKMTGGSGITLTDGTLMNPQDLPAGVVPGWFGAITFIPADTATMKAGVYMHKLSRTDAGFVSSIIPGRGYPGATVQLLQAA